MRKGRIQSGYTLIELVLVLVIIGILASVGLKSLSAVNQTGRIEETKQELERLAYAIAGNPALVSGGTRTDFGYIGDVGGLPPNLDALIANPGGMATWRGPYISDPFSDGGPTDWFKYDGWGVAYSYTGGRTISSTGGPSTLTRELAGSVADLLYNRVTAVITDLDKTPPGPDYVDSIRFDLVYGNGTGGLTTASRNPRPDGLVEFDSIPIGLHTLRIIYFPDSDTLIRKVPICPGQNSYTESSLAEDYWTGN
jgi:general secretion pathway protein G